METINENDSTVVVSMLGYEDLGKEQYNNVMESHVVKYYREDDPELKRG